MNQDKKRNEVADIPGAAPQRHPGLCLLSAVARRSDLSAEKFAGLAARR